MTSQFAYSFQDYAKNHHQSIIKYAQQRRSNPAHPSSLFQSKQFTIQNFLQTNTKCTPLYNQLQYTKTNYTKNKIIIHNAHKKCLESHKKDYDIKQLTSNQIKEKIKKKIFDNHTEQSNHSQFSQKNHSAFLSRNNPKIKLHQLIAINYHHIDKQKVHQFQEDLRIKSNICTISEYEPKKKRHIEDINFSEQSKNKSAMKQSENFRNLISSEKGERKYFRLTKPMYMHKIQNKTSNCFQVKKQKQIVESPIYYNQMSVRFLQSQQNADSNLKRRIFQYFPIKQEVYSQAFTIVHSKNNKNKILYQYNSQNQMQIASLTKTMTCLLILLLSQKFNIDLKTSQVKVGEKAAKLQGTSAKLLYSDVLSIHDLLYGLMLPSGNDAALALAQWGGKSIRMNCNRRINSTSPMQRGKKCKLISQNIIKRSYISLFIYHMNILAKILNLKNTKFANVHGLMNKKNYSCTNDIMTLCLFAMKKSNFKQIVNTKTYRCLIKNKIYANQRQVIWINTNKLLNIDGFCGIKTGITPSAGPCIASCFKISEQQYIYIVLLKTKSISHRFQESKKLLVEIIKKLYYNSNRKVYLSVLNVIGSNTDVTQQNEDENNFELVDESCQSTLNEQISDII